MAQGREYGREWDDVQAQAAAEDAYDQNAIAAVDRFSKVLRSMGPETVADVSQKLQAVVHRLERTRRNVAVLLGGNDLEVDDMFRQLIARLTDYDSDVAANVLLPGMREMFQMADDMNAPGGVQALLRDAVVQARKFRAQERRQWAADRAETDAATKDSQQNGHGDDPAF